MFFFPPEICFSALSQELRNSDKAIARHCLQSALSNGLFPCLIWQVPTGRLQCQVSFWNGADGHVRAVDGQNVKCSSTEDNLSSLNNITKQFSQSNGTATAGFLTHTCPDTLPCRLSSSSTKPFVTTRACVYIYFGCTVQWRSKLCKKKKTFSNLYNI